MKQNGKGSLNSSKGHKRMQQERLSVLVTRIQLLEGSVNISNVITEIEQLVGEPITTRTYIIPSQTLNTTTLT